jgi:hypothetical protein
MIYVHIWMDIVRAADEPPTTTLDLSGRYQAGRWTQR